MNSRLGMGAGSVMILVMLLSGAVVVTVPETVSALQDGDYTYTVEGSPAVANITGYTGAGGAVIIPSTLGGYVTAIIGDNAFNNVNGQLLTSVTIPDSVTSIGDAAFNWCHSLTALTIGDSVTSIGDWAFTYTSFSSLVIPDSVESIGQSAFAVCHSLSSLTIGSGVVTIGSGAFSSCDSLPILTIPVGVISIGQGAFAFCTSLVSIEVDPGNLDYCSIDGVLYDKEITRLMQWPGEKAGACTIPSDVVSIDSHAFAHCYHLTSVIIPASLSSIGYEAFRLCTSLTTFDVDAGNLDYSSIDGVLYDNPGTELIICPGGKAGALVIPSGVEVIQQDSCAWCMLLTSVTFPESVNFIGYNAFEDCTSITTLTIGNGVSVISGFAFRDCMSLTTVIIGTRVTTIGICAFKECTLLASITFLGLVAPATVGINWILDTNAAIMGHAYESSNLPAIGDSFYGLTMGAYLSPAPPGAPTSLIATSGNAQVTLTWTAPLDVGSAAITGYNLYRASGETGTYGLIASPASSTYTDTSLSNGQPFFYKVSAVNSVGEGPQTGEVAAIPATVPTAPRGLHASPGDSVVDLNWTAPEYAGPGELVYHLYRNNLLIWSGTGLIHIDSTAFNGVPYSYEISANNSVGWGPNSTAVQVTLVAPVSPAMPLDFVVTAGDAQVTLHWSRPASSGSSTITGYKIYRGADPASISLLTTVTTTSYIDAELTNGQAYYYRVCACSSVGDGTPTEVIDVTPQRPGTDTSASSTVLYVGIGAIIVVAGVGGAILLIRRRK